MTRFCSTLCLCLFLVSAARTQKIKILSQGPPVSLRGLSAPDDKVVWVCGSQGTVGLSTDGGINWKWMTVPNYEQSDFRDLEAFSDREAVIMGITRPAVILKTKDGGKTWKTVFQDSSQSIFLDGMDFSGTRGILIGDPVNNKIFLAQTNDRGDHWKLLSGKNQTVSEQGEAFFAASGSAIKWLPGNHYAFVSGGKRSSLYLDGSGIHRLLLTAGKESTGANSIAVSPSDSNLAFITGGDFAADSITAGNAVAIRFHPFRQAQPDTPPRGYRSCVEYITGQTLICCGTSGVDISTDGGMNWKLVSGKSFHVCAKSGAGKAVFLAGAQGIIGRLDW
jgi:photosystem II stability/assembly factor-like uncharacterized protein